MTSDIGRRSYSDNCSPPRYAWEPYDGVVKTGENFIQEYSSDLEPYVANAHGARALVYSENVEYLT